MKASKAVAKLEDLASFLCHMHMSTSKVPYSFEHRMHEWFKGKLAYFPLYRFRNASKKFENLSCGIGVTPTLRLFLPSWRRL